jgi:hypothetical protein
VASKRKSRIHTERRSDLGLFFAACLAGFFLLTDISISFWTGDALRRVFSFGALFRADAALQGVHQVNNVFTARRWLISSTNVVS